MIFKREKEVARKLEFDGLYVTKQPPEEDIKGQWDRLVVHTPYVQHGSGLIGGLRLHFIAHPVPFFFFRSFPSNYWDKFVKRKVRVSLLLRCAVFSAHVSRFVSKVDEPFNDHVASLKTLS